MDRKVDREINMCVRERELLNIYIYIYIYINIP